MWVAALQLNSTAEVDANLARARELIREAAAQGARLVALPEYFAYLGPEAGLTALAQPVDGPLVAGFRELAAELKIFLLLGTFPELADPAQALPYNTSLLLGPQGQVLARYRKLHLFDADLPGRPPHRESRSTRPGAEVVAAPLTGTPAVAGLAVCYDLRFPELFRALMAKGANLFLLPAAFTLTTGPDHWEVLLRARAIENQAYMVAPAQYGQHAPRRRCYGRSLIVDPWGLVLAQAPDGEGVISARLDFERLQSLRAEFPCLSHCRLK
jgi:predicted amidohydrolase